MDLNDNQHSLLTFRVGPVLCCAPTLPVSSIITPPKLTHPPGSDQAQPGIFRHGSYIVKVIDLRQKFGVDINEQIQPGNLIISRFNDESYAFWVDQIIDVIDFPKEGWGNLPAAIPRGVFSRTLLLNKKIHLYTEFEKLVTIKDLGYLKHYIQQLKKEDDKTTTSEIKNNRNAALKNKGVKKNASDEDTINKSKSLTDTAAVKNIDKQETLTKQAVTSKTESIIPASKSSLQAQAQKTLDTTIKDKKSTPSKVTSSIASTTKFNSSLTNKSIDKKHPAPQSTSKTSVIKKDIRSTVVSDTKTSVAKVKPTISTDTYKTEKPKTTLASFDSTTSHKNISSNKIDETFTSQEKSNFEDEGSYIGLVLFIFILLGALALGGFFLLTKEPTRSLKIEPTYEKPVLIKPEQEEEITKEPSLVIQEAETITEEIITPELSPVESTQTETNLFTTKKNEETPYHAEITQQESEITITLHRPSPEKLESTIVSPKVETGLEAPIAESKPQEIKQTPIDESVSIQPAVETLKQHEITKPLTEKKAIEEIIHIVVKGDTLWAIAKKYVNDPFLYPELARLSNIKNPHRIYPGNRVRIRFINN